MKRSRVFALQVGVLGLGLALIAPLQAAAAPFGGAGGLGDCTSFVTCTATAFSSTNTLEQTTFSSLTGGYNVPAGFSPGVNTIQDVHNEETTAAVRAGDPPCPLLNCAATDWDSFAVARARSDFAVNRASASTSEGASGTDVSFSQTRTAQVQVLTVADADSVWRDVWTFNTNGHFSATIALDGHSSTAANPFFPDTFDYVAGATLGEWFYDLNVWDVTNLSVSEDFETGGPTLIARLQDHTGIGNEQRPTFASTLALDFDFVSGVSYVVTAELGVHSRNGREINLYDTAQLTDVVLSNGAELSALSGHDYLVTVPEPGQGALMLVGLAGMAMLRCFKRGLRPQ
jgi:hypothetical protein